MSDKKALSYQHGSSPVELSIPRYSHPRGPQRLKNLVPSRMELQPATLSVLGSALVVAVVTQPMSGARRSCPKNHGSPQNQRKF